MPPDLPPPPSERPWLLPSNRKLRHLQGIALRNLTLASPSLSRGKTALDDVVLPNSFTSLTPPRPTRAMRRRSTLEWTTASPLVRQKRLEDMTAARMADSFFTLHLPSAGAGAALASASADSDPLPVYISELADKAMNPNFKFFDLHPAGPAVTRRDRLTVRVWAKSEHMADWHLLVDCPVHLASLHFLGKTLASVRHALPQNCLLFHMTDGIYTPVVDMDLALHPPPATSDNMLAPPKDTPDGRPSPSSSYDALMRLSTLDDCIQDALATRDRIAHDIEAILDANRHAMATLDRLPEAQDRLDTVQAAVTAEHRRVLAMRRRRDDLAATMAARRQKIAAGRAKSALVASELPTRQELTRETSDALEAAADAIAGQRRRLCTDLLRIYPIDPLPTKTLHFTIRHLPLPNSSFDDTLADPHTTAAALGYTAQLLSTLASYLSVLLPYPLHPCGSTSTISDPLALGHAAKNNPRDYPLYTAGVVRYRFEYAVFLLNKNIEILSNALGIRPLDIRHTLPNLKYALYVATAGKGELPSRKAGGIRGLLRGDASTGWGSRKGSLDSTATLESLDTDHLRGANNTKHKNTLSSGFLPGSRLRPVE